MKIKSLEKSGNTIEYNVDISDDFPLDVFIGSTAFGKIHNAEGKQVIPKEMVCERDTNGEEIYFKYITKSDLKVNNENINAVGNSSDFIFKHVGKIYDRIALDAICKDVIIDYVSRKGSAKGMNDICLGKEIKAYADNWGSSVVEKGYYGLHDTFCNGWVFERITDLNNHNKLNDSASQKKLANRFKSDLQAYGIKNFENRIRNVMNLKNDEIFHKRMEAKETKTGWIVSEYDYRKWKFMFKKVNDA